MCCPSGRVHVVRTRSYENSVSGVDPEGRRGRSPICILLVKQLRRPMIFRHFYLVTVFMVSRGYDACTLSTGRTRVV